MNARSNPGRFHMRNPFGRGRAIGALAQLMRRSIRHLDTGRRKTRSYSRVISR
jgi:hypothetical protein